MSCNPTDIVPRGLSYHHVRGSRRQFEQTPSLPAVYSEKNDVSEDPDTVDS